jgi:Flp pilus assembly protein TadG
LSVVSRRLRKIDAIADEQIVAFCPSERRRAQAGFVLIATSIALTILLALAALGIDLGRMYVIRAELQSFTDAAALSAAMELNQTEAGLANARAGAARLATGPHAMRWDLGTQPIENIVTSFSADNQTWQDRPKGPGDVRFVRVVATEPAPVIFMRIFQPRTSSNVSAASIAAKIDTDARLVQ